MESSNLKNSRYTPGGDDPSHNSQYTSGGDEPKIPNLFNASELLFGTPHVEHGKCLCLDLVALLCDIFIYIEKNCNPDEQKFLCVRDCMYTLNNSLFYEIQNERFSDACVIMRHIPIDQTVAQAKQMIYDYFIEELKTTFVLDLENLITSIDLDDLKSIYKVHTFVFNFAKVMTPKIIMAWSQLKKSGEQIPADEKLNKINISF